MKLANDVMVHSIALSFWGQATDGIIPILGKTITK